MFDSGAYEPSAFGQAAETKVGHVKSYVGQGPVLGGSMLCEAYEIKNLGDNLI